MTWSSLRAIGNSLPAKSTILIPLIGYYIILNQNIADGGFFQLAFPAHKNQNDLIETIYNTRIFLLYFALSFIGIGSIVYQIRCPDTIKTYGDEIEFAERIQQSITKRDISNFLKEISRAKCYQCPLDLEFAERALLSSGATPLGSETLIDTLKIYYDVVDHSNKISRSSTLVLYIAGFIFLGFPSAIVFIKVCRGLITHL